MDIEASTPVRHAWKKEGCKLSSARSKLSFGLFCVYVGCWPGDSLIQKGLNSLGTPASWLTCNHNWSALKTEETNRADAVLYHTMRDIFKYSSWHHRHIFKTWTLVFSIQGHDPKMYHRGSFQGSDLTSLIKLILVENHSKNKFWLLYDMAALTAVNPV